MISFACFSSLSLKGFLASVQASIILSIYTSKIYSFEYFWMASWNFVMYSAIDCTTTESPSFLRRLLTGATSGIGCLHVGHWSFWRLPKQVLHSTVWCLLGHVHPSTCLDMSMFLRQTIHVGPTIPDCSIYDIVIILIGNHHIVLTCSPPRLKKLIWFSWILILSPSSAAR